MLLNRIRLGLLGKFRFSGDIPDIVKRFDMTTKLRVRNADDPQYIKFGSIRDDDPLLNIRSGQLKLLGYASSLVLRFCIISYIRRRLPRTGVRPMHCDVYQRTKQSFRDRNLCEEFYLVSDRMHY